MPRSIPPPPVYFDSAATSWPKPPPVRNAVAAALYFSGNPGRGGHPLSARAGETVFHARRTAADLFGASPENVVFTLNCTHALNLAIKGALRRGDHVIISSMEHNAVYRPVTALAEAGMIRFSIAQVRRDPRETVENIRRLIRRNTRAVICTLVSNVTGLILPYDDIAALCRAHGLIFIADGAQACGVLPVSLQNGMKLLCTAGHKGLLGPMGTGLLISDGTVSLRPLMQGGTGSLSASPHMPDYLPDALEPGTVNVPGIAGLDAGMQTVRKRGYDAIFQHEHTLCLQFLRGLSEIPGAQIFRDETADFAPVVSFVMPHEHPADTAARLAARGFCLRAGLHCAPLAHQTIGTAEHGTVRFAPAFTNAPEEVEALLDALKI